MPDARCPMPEKARVSTTKSGEPPVFAKVLLEKPELLKEVWEVFDRMSDKALMGERRVYGGGLRKLESRKLGNGLVDRVFKALSEMLIS